MLIISVHSCLLYRSSAQSAHTFDTSSEYALKQIHHNCIDVSKFSCTSIIKHVCKVYVSERMSDCPGVGGRKYDVECGVVRCGLVG